MSSRHQTPAGLDTHPLCSRRGIKSVVIIAMIDHPHNVLSRTA